MPKNLPVAKLRKMLVRNETRNTVLATEADLADRGATRRKGLLGRESLPAGLGLWIVPCEAVHTFGMKFPIDVLYLDRKRRIRKVRSGLAPQRLSMCLLAHSVLELPVGTAQQTQTQPGDQISFSFLD